MGTKNLRSKCESGECHGREKRALRSDEDRERDRRARDQRSRARRPVDEGRDFGDGHRDGCAKKRSLEPTRRPSGDRCRRSDERQREVARDRPVRCDDCPETPYGDDQSDAAEGADDRKRSPPINPEREGRSHNKHPNRARVPLDALAEVVDGRAVLDEVSCVYGRCDPTARRPGFRGSISPEAAHACFADEKSARGSSRREREIDESRENDLQSVATAQGAREKGT